MKILFAGSEATPFCKTGGLADVLGSLPPAMAERNHDVSLVLPKHQVIKDTYQETLTLIHQTSVQVHNKEEYVGIETMTHNGIRVYVIDNEYYFGYRPNLYGDFDDGERYGFYVQAIKKLLEYLNTPFDIVHAHDWQTGLLSYVLKSSNDDLLKYPKMVFTIHNIAYQGQFDKGLFPYLGIPYSPEIEFSDMINFLKTGIVTSDYITTVSKTYSEELTHAYFAYGMEKLLNERRHIFTGILNGIDTDSFNPKTDTKIAHNYSAYNYLKGKKANKDALLNMFHVQNGHKPVVGIVSRLTEQKGLNLVLDTISPFLEDDRLTLIVLGTGEQDIEGAFENLKQRFPRNVGLYIGYSDTIARQIYAGSDLFLMPSRFEPCGLAQMISLRYGTLPLVRQTGGLKDTITPFNQYTHEGNGFGFMNFDAEDFARTLEAALQTYKTYDVFKKMIRRGMMEDFSWTRSAETYEQMYQHLLGGK